MRRTKYLILSLLALVLVLGFVSPLKVMQNVFSWHEQLGISDERAAEVYRNNPNDPQILKWRNSIQFWIDMFNIGCTEEPLTEELRQQQQQNCPAPAQELHDICVHHPNTSVACEDQRINKWLNVAGSSEIDQQDFRSSLSNIVNQSQSLTKSYQDEIGKWKSHQYDDSTFVSITDSYIPKFENLVKSAQNLTYPTNYKYVYDALVNSLQSETDSNKHFRNFIQSGNKTENQISIDLLSKAWQYEMTYSKFLSTP